MSLILVSYSKRNPSVESEPIRQPPTVDHSISFYSYIKTFIIFLFAAFPFSHFRSSFNDLKPFITLVLTQNYPLNLLLLLLLSSFYLRVKSLNFTPILLEVLKIDRDCSWPWRAKNYKAAIFTIKLKWRRRQLRFRCLLILR